MKRTKCPVPTDSQWVKLVNKVGIDQAYLEYLKNNEEIPDVDNIQYSLAPKEQSDLLLKGFDSFYQQNEAVNTMASSVLAFMRDNPDVKTGRLSKAVDSFKTDLQQALVEDPDNSGYKLVLDNINNLRDLVKKKLELLGLITPAKLAGINVNSKLEIPTEENQAEGAEEVDNLGDWKDEWTFQYDSKANALQKVKQFLAFIPRTEYNEDQDSFLEIESFLGTPSYMSYDEVYEQLRAILSGVENTWEAMEEQLKAYQKSKPFIYNILYQLSPENYQGDLEQLKRQFVSTMASSYGGFKTILVKQKDDGSYYFNIIDTDQSSIEKTIRSTWNGLYKRTNLFEENEKGDLIVNKDKINSYLEKIKEQAKEPTKTGIRNLLTSLGIEISDQTLNKLFDSSFNKLDIKRQFTEKTGLFKLISDRLSGKISSDTNDTTDDSEDIDTTEINNPLVNNSAIRELARLESTNSEQYYTNTFKDGQNNTVYSYSFNKFLTKEFNKLLVDPSYVKSLLNITFNKPIVKDNEVIYKTWLYQLDTNPVFKSIFNISPFDTIKVSTLGSDGTKLNSMSDLDLELSQVAFIQNSGASKAGIGRVVKYLLTIPSKTTSYVVQGSGIDLKLQFDDQGNYNIDPTTKDALYTIVASEHNRIISQQERKSDNKAFNTGSKYFYFFPELNDVKDNEGRYILFNQDQSGKKTTIKLPTDKIGDITIEKYLRDKVLSIIKSDITNKIESWKSLSIIRNGELKLVDQGYRSKILIPQSKGNKNNEITLAAADYIIQSTLAKFNSHQTFIDDPAIYFKKNVKETWDNVGKRLTNLIAPFKEGMIDKNNKYFLSVKLDDLEINAINYDQLNTRLKSYYEDNNIQLPYKDIDGTDAQEYTTLKEDLAVKYSYGNIDTKTYNTLIDKINKEGDDLYLDANEIDVIFTGVKPVYSSRIVSGEDDVVYREYVKSASIPLIPQFTKGLELDKLRVAMENLEKSKKLSIRAAFNSATKIGGKGSINIWNKDGSIKDNLDLEKYSILLDRSNFGIQQEIPYDENKEETVKSTQETKLLFDGLQDVSGFRYEGKQYNGKDLQDIYIDLHKQLYENGLQNLEKKITIDGRFDMSKLIPILSEEGVKRGYTPAQQSFLQLNKEKTDFELPFWAHVSNDKEQSMITSMYTNNVIKTKMHGKSYVLVSEEGTKGISKSITYTSEYNPAVGLKPMRIVYKKDKEIIEQEVYDELSKVDKEGYKEITKPAQVLLPWNLRNKTGKRLDINKYIKDGLIDTSKLPKEILTQFGFRIPNQGHNSMALIEVVGFLPDLYQDIVIASRNFITQMGSDFDVDKLYTYDYYLDTREDGSIIKQEDNIKNKIVDIHKSVLYNTKVFNSVVKPLDLGRLKYQTTDGKTKGIAQELKLLKEKNINNYLNPDYSKDKYLQSVDGKAMVGIESLSNTFSALVQGKDLYLQKKVSDSEGKISFVQDYIIFSNSEGKELVLSDLSSPYTINNNKKNQIDAAYQSAAVDNEKDPILSYINSNPQVSSVQTLLRKLGLEEELSLFLTQPVIVEYVNKVKLSKSSLSEDRKREEDILNELIDTYRSEIEQLSSKIKNRNLEDLPIGDKHFRQVLHNTESVKVLDLPLLTNQEIQAASILKFAKLKTYGDVLSRAQGLLSIESRGVGKSLLDLADKRDSIDKILKNQQIANLRKVAGDLEDDGVLVPNTLTGHGIVNSIYAADDTISQSHLMPFNSKLFRKLLDEYEQITGREPNTDAKYEIWKAIKSYNFSKMFSNEERERILFDRQTPSLNTRINNLLKTKLKNNPFILRLDLSKVDLAGKKPSYVFYNASKEEDIEELNVYQGLLDLFYSSDPETNQIGEDLVKYFYINGGNQASKEWGRYINTSMINDIGVSAFVRDVNFNNEEAYGYKQFGSVSNVLLQLIQHKTYLAPKLTNTGNLDIAEIEIIIPINAIPKEIKRERGYSPLFSISRNLFLYAGKEESGNLIYTKIPTLGTKFYTEYQDSGDKIATSLLTKKFKTNKENPTEFQNKYQPDQVITESIPNPIVKTEVSNYINTTLPDSLVSIAQEGSSKYNKDLANYFSRFSNLLNTVEIKEYVGDTTGNAFYSGKDNNIYLNKGNIPKNKAAYEQVILMETVHALTTAIFNKDFTPTKEQVEAKNRLELIYDNTRDKVLKGELSNSGWEATTLNEFDRIYTKFINKEILTQKEKDFVAVNRKKYYGITAVIDDNGNITKKNVEDFVHDVLLVPEFRVLTDSIPYTANKSLTERFSELINTILKHFSELLNLKNNTYSQEAFATIFKQFDITNNNPILSKKDVDQKIQDSYTLSAEEIKVEEDRKYARIVNDFESRLNSISKDISKATSDQDKELSTRLINRYKEVKDERDFIIAENTFEAIMKTANNDLLYVENILNNPELTLNDLLYSEKVLATWSKIDDNNIYSVLTEFDINNQTQRSDDVSDIVAKANKLQRKLTTIEVGRFVEYAQQETGKTIEIEDITKLQDISFLQANTRDISTSNNIVLSVADKWMRKADFESVTELNKLISDLDKVTEALQDEGSFKEKGFTELYGQVDEDGKLTGEIVNPLTGSYYSKRDILLDNISLAPNSSARKIEAEKYYRWIKDNHTIADVSKLFQESSDGTFKYKPDTDYLKSLSLEVKDYKKLVDTAKKLIEEYNEELALQINYYEGNPDGFRNLELWKAENSPLVYIDNLKNGLTSRKVGEKYIKNIGWKYVSKRALPKWEDSKYNNIQSNKILKDYYDYYMKVVKDLYHYLPYDKRKDIKPTEIPNINKNLVEELTQVGVGKSWNRTWSALLENVSVTNTDPTGIINPVTGNFEKDFKIEYLIKLHPDRKSYDLSKVLKLFATEAVGYKYKSKVEDSVRLAESVLRYSVEKQLKSTGEVNTDKFGSITTIKGLKNLYSQFDYAFDAWYGNKKDQREGVTNKKLITPKDREQIEKEISEIPADIPEAKRIAIEKAITDRYTRRFSWSKLGDTVLQYIQIKGMGWNIFGGLNNAFFGQMANFAWSAGNTDFSDSDMTKGLTTMLSFDKDTTKKVESLMTKLNTVKQLREVVYKSTSNYNKARKGIEKLAPYEIYAKGEYFVQGQVMVALLNAQKVDVTVNGEPKSIPLYEAFNIDGNWNEELYGKNAAYQENGKSLLELKNKLDTLLKKIHGNYDPNSAMLSNKKFIGRAAMQFRRWIPEGVAQRFDSEKYDIHLQRNTEGRYVTYANLGLKDSLKTLLKQVLYRNSDKAFEGLDLDEAKLEITKENMKKNLREIHYKLTLLGIYLLLAGLDDDDEDDSMKFFRNYAINTIFRLQDDIEFYYSPMAFENITRSALPIMTVITDSAKFMDAVQDTVIGEGTYKSGIHSGDSKLLWRSAKLVPFSSAISSIINKGEAAENFRK